MLDLLLVVGGAFAAALGAMLLGGLDDVRRLLLGALGAVGPVLLVLRVPMAEGAGPTAACAAYALVAAGATLLAVAPIARREGMGRLAPLAWTWSVSLAAMAGVLWWVTGRAVA